MTYPYIFDTLSSATGKMLDDNFNYANAYVDTKIDVAIKFVNNIAALRALLKTGSPSAFALGYYTKGDGGGGEFYYDNQDTTSADNGGTIIVANDGGRWKPVNIDHVTLAQFGVKGDGSDDTLRAQAALSWGASANRIIYGGIQCVTITSGITVAGPGLIFDIVSYGGTANDPGIKVTGTGYTGVTVTGAKFIRLTVWGNAQTVNGVLFSNPQALKECHLRVYNIDGFGCKINRSWDCLFNTISVELCGNASEYAFSMNDDGDTCNMTHILRLQVEQSNQKAIFVSPNTLCCVIDNIHSERTTPAAGVNSWYLGGNRCLYNSARLNSNAPDTNATLYISAAHSQYNTLVTEGGIVTKLDAYSTSSITLIEPDLAGVTSAVTGQTGFINVIGGILANLNTDAYVWRVEGTKINLLTIGYSANDPQKARFINCNITTLASASTQSAATFNTCTIGTHGNLLEGITVLNNTTVNNAGSSTLALNYRTLYAYGSTINAPIVVDNGKIIGFDTVFNGSMNQSAGPMTSTFNEGCYSTGAVFNLGILTGGTNYLGMYTKNMAPAVGSPKGWICSAAGTPGTWTSTGNL